MQAQLATRAFRALGAEDVRYERRAAALGITVAVDRREDIDSYDRP